MRALPNRLTILLLVAVFALSVFRARTQSFTVDEAHVFRMFVNKPLGEMARTYDACNHVLHTLLMKLSRSMLGTGELALRIPSLLGALLLLRALYVLTRKLFSGWWQPLVAAAAVLHPLVLDHMVAARGYGLGLALLLWSLCYATDWLTEGFRDRDILRAGIFSGLAIGANLTFLVPAASMGLVLLALGFKGRRGWTIVEKFGVASAVLAFLINVLPLLRATGEHFYYGEASWHGVLLSYVRGSLKARSILSQWAVTGQDVICVVIAALFCVVAVLSGSALMGYMRQRVPSFRLGPAVLFGGTLAVAAVVHTLGFHLGGIPYPAGRTGLYLIPLLVLALAAAVRFSRVRAAQGGAAAVLALACAFWLTQLDARFFVEWRYDASTLAMLRRLDEDRRTNEVTGEVRLAMSEHFTPTVQYYRLRRSMHWLPENPTVHKLEKANANYYLLVGQHAGLVPQLGLTVVHKDGLTGTVLARRSL